MLQNIGKNKKVLKVGVFGENDDILTVQKKKYHTLEIIQI